MFGIFSGLQLWLICGLSFNSELTTAGAAEIMLMPDCLLCAPMGRCGDPVRAQRPFAAGGAPCFAGLEEWQVAGSSPWMGTASHRNSMGVRDDL